MDIKSVALQMYPYWILGAVVLAATVKAGFKDLIRVEKKAVLNWVRFLFFITMYRIILFRLFPGSWQESAKNIAIIPWPLTLTVFWEDACHGLPLLILQKLIGTDKWWKWLIHGPLTALVMVEFGLGHVYQGIIPAMLLSLYIPYSIRLAKKFGFGTVMIGHTLFDLVTILTVKFLMGV